MPNQNQITCRPREALVAISREYPGLWKHMDRVRAMRGKSLSAWPECCFLPGSFTLGMLASSNPDNMDFLRRCELTKETMRIHALAAWRVTQGIYRFDKTIYDEILNTPLEGSIPTTVLCQLPEWCVYIETPGLMFEDETIHGFWVFVDWPASCDAGILCILLDSITQSTLALELSEVPIDQQIALIAAKIAEQHGVDTDMLAEFSKASVSLASHVVSLALYLCSQGAEVGDGVRRPTRPIPKRIKGGECRLFPPDRITTWDVGVRLGSALRRATQYTSTGEGGANVRNAPRGHIRRAHWHGFRSGPRKLPDGSHVVASDRKFEVRWLPPLAINLEDVNNLPSTIRTVS